MKAAELQKRNTAAQEAGWAHVKEIAPQHGARAGDATGPALSLVLLVAWPEKSHSQLPNGNYRSCRKKIYIHRVESKGTRRRLCAARDRLDNLDEWRPA